MKKYLLPLLITALFYCLCQVAELGTSILLAHGTGPEMSGGTGPVRGGGSGSGLSDPMTTRGDVIIRNSSNATARLGVGANGEVLQSDGTDISWGSTGAGDVTAGANLGNNLLIRGDGATKGVQNSGITVDDSDNITALGNITGAAGQMTITGGTAAGDDLLLLSTSNGTKGTIALGSLTAGLVYDAVNVRLSIGSDENTVVVNTTTIGSKITTHTEGATDLLDISPHRHSDTAGFGAAMGFVRSRGSEGAETAVQDNDILARINFYGHDGTDYEIAGQIDCEVDGTVGANQMGGALVFSTTADGANSVTERMRIGSDGSVTYGSGTPDIKVSTDGSGVYTRAAINQTNNETWSTDLETTADTAIHGGSATTHDFSAIDVLTKDINIEGTFDLGTPVTFVESDATPDVSLSAYWDTGTDTATITDFDGAGIENGQNINVFSKGAITYDVTSSGLRGGSDDIVTANGDMTAWMYDGTDWVLRYFMDNSTNSGTDKKTVVFYLNADTALTTGDGKAFSAPLIYMAGWNLTEVIAYRSIGNGTDSYQIRNVTQAADVLSTEITIDAGELTSGTAAVPPVIDTGQNDVTLYDQYAVDVNTVGTDSAHVRIQATYRPQ